MHVELPDQYPYKSPSIGFTNRIYHPNIDEMYQAMSFLFSLTLMCLCRSGTVCLDVINQTWSPMFDLINVFEVFLPQLLRYPNPADPLNGEAAAMLIRDPAGFEAKVKDYVKKYACGKDKAASKATNKETALDDASEVSSLAGYSEDEDDVNGLEL